ncbi:MAG: hypothetical protein HOO96_08455 [Polyangiaceae bacterium]|nr:hypothetical protein [Polyangiaceae bacterium]
MQRRRKSIDAALRSLRVESLRGDALRQLANAAYDLLRSERRAPRRQVDAVFANLTQVARRETDPDLRREAVYALGQWYRQARAARVLLGIVGDAACPPLIRGQAAEGLGSTMPRTPRAAPLRADASKVLGEALRSPEAEVRFWVVYTVGQLDLREHRAELERMAASDDGEAAYMWRISLEAADVLSFWDRGEWPSRRTGTGEIMEW